MVVSLILIICALIMYSLAMRECDKMKPFEINPLQDFVYDSMEWVPVIILVLSIGLLLYLLIFT